MIEDETLPISRQEALRLLEWTRQTLFNVIEEKAEKEKDKLENQIEKFKNEVLSLL